MRFVKPAIFLIAKSKPQSDSIRDWLLHIGCDTDVAEKFAAGDGKADGERIVELAGRRCYLAFQPEKLNPNVTKIRESIIDYCRNILKSKHGSVTAHASFTFAIEGISRVMTAELNRHAIGAAISEGSMRYIRFTDIPFVETPLLTITAEDKQDPEYNTYMESSFDGDVSHLRSLAVKKQRTRELFRESTLHAEKVYSLFQEIWAEELRPDSTFIDKKHVTSLGRRPIPMGVATGGVWTYNIRALRHICEMRASEAAEEEICVVAVMMLKTMMKEEPSLFGDFKEDANGFWIPEFSKI